MEGNYKYDVFISHHHSDQSRANDLFQSMKELGLRPFFSSKDLERGKEFPDVLRQAVIDSHLFALYWSKETKGSSWVLTEVELFYKKCYLLDKNRRMYIYLEPSCNEEDLPVEYRALHRTDSPENLVAEVIKIVLNDTRNTCELALIGQNNKILDLDRQLKNEHDKFKGAQAYYRYNRFWGTMSSTNDVHIFTCARDFEQENDSHRGHGGRTNIDLWDYRTVLDITKFLAANFPHVKVSIEDPISKLHDKDMEKTFDLANHMTHMRSLIENKDCIIIGSPDVNDFAEIVLAKIHGITPYGDVRSKTKGFVIIKELKKGTKSSFYWRKEDEEEEGVARINRPGEYEYYPHQSRNTGGTTYGILVVAKNPFCRDGTMRQIIILSGFTGVATNGLAKLLTDERCLPEFFELDNAYSDIKRDIEALISVDFNSEDYTIDDSNFKNRDTRKLMMSDSPITFKTLVEI